MKESKQIDDYKLFEIKSQIIPVKLDKVCTEPKGVYCFAYVSIKSFTVAGTKVFEKP